MSRYRLLPIGTILMFALTANAQQTTPSVGGSAKSTNDGGHAGLPTVESQLKTLTEKLNLSSDQQAQIKPILSDLHRATEKLMQDKSLSQEERLAKVRPERYKADEKMRARLSDEQKKKLDQYEQGPHSEMHGDLSGSKTPPQP